MSVNLDGPTQCQNKSRVLPRFVSFPISYATMRQGRILALSFFLIGVCIPCNGKAGPGQSTNMRTGGRGDMYIPQANSTMMPTRRRWRGDFDDPYSGSRASPEGSIEGRNDDAAIISEYPRADSLGFRDILNCNSRQWSWSGNESSERQQLIPDKPMSWGGNSFVDYRGKLEGSTKLTHSPVVYRYYGRSRTRGHHPADSIHFILLGPNVDHWKALGQTLASRGFNSIACERLDKSSSRNMDNDSEDVPNLVLDVMDALKWKRVMLVGCDRESILAMETAMMLSPDQVVGLVLAGDLSGANQAASESGMGGLDDFLRRVLDCPFLTVWGGDSPGAVVSGSSVHSALEADSSNRCVILGGGSAPHRLKPEQFAWVLTRFVEERVESSFRSKDPLRSGIRGNSQSLESSSKVSIDGFFRTLNLPFEINSLTSPEGRLLLGRAIAAGIFYITAMRVLVIQYGILRAGLIAIKTKYETIDALTKRSFQAIGAFIINFGYIPRLFTVKRASDDEEDENRRSGTIVLENQEREVTEKSTEDTNEEGALPSESESSDGSKGNTDPQVPPESGEILEDGEKESEVTDEELDRPLFKPFFFLDNVVT